MISNKFKIVLFYIVLLQKNVLQESRNVVYKLRKTNDGCRDNSVDIIIIKFIYKTFFFKKLAFD